MVSARHATTVNNLADLANRDDGCVWVVSASHVNTVNNLADLANRDDGCVWVYQPVMLIL